MEESSLDFKINNFFLTSQLPECIDEKSFNLPKHKREEIARVKSRRRGGFVNPRYKHQCKAKDYDELNNWIKDSHNQIDSLVAKLLVPEERDKNTKTIDKFGLATKKRDLGLLTNADKSRLVDFCKTNYTLYYLDQAIDKIEIKALKDVIVAKKANELAKAKEIVKEKAKRQKIAKQKAKKEKFENEQAALVKKLKAMLGYENAGVFELSSYDEHIYKSMTTSLESAFHISVLKANNAFKQSVSNKTFTKPNKGEFETTEQYNKRVIDEQNKQTQASDKARAGLIENRVTAFEKVVKEQFAPIVNKSFIYDADKQLFDITIGANGFELIKGVVKVPLNQAKQVKEKINLARAYITVSVKISENFESIQLHKAAFIVYDKNSPAKTDIYPIEFNSQKVNIAEPVLAAAYKKRMAVKRKAQEVATKRARERKIAHAKNYPFYAEISCKTPSGSTVFPSACFTDGGEISLVTDNRVNSYTMVHINQMVNSNGRLFIDLTKTFKIRTQNGSKADYMSTEISIFNTLTDIKIKSISASGAYKIATFTN